MSIPPIRLSRHTQSVPATLWDDVARLYATVFAAPPYAEDAEALAQIAQWGPRYLSSTGASLVTAVADGHLVGMCLARPLSVDAEWQRLLTRLDVPAAPVALAGAADVLVVQELAVDPAARRRGIAASCVTLLARSTPATRMLLAVDERATAARSFYAARGFTAVGAVTLRDGVRRLNVLTADVSAL